MSFIPVSLVASFIDFLVEAKEHSAATDNVMKSLRDDGYSDEWITFQVTRAFQKRYGYNNWKKPVVLTERRKEPETKPCVKTEEHKEEHKEVKKQSDSGYFSCHNEYNGPMRDIRYVWD